MPLSAGDKLGPYEILDLVGAGGMGEVYRAHDPRLGRDVAIKVSAQQFSERFEREAHAIAALNHPNICQVYDIGPNYLVMEFIEGAPLAGPLPLEVALRHAVQIADALAAAHAKGVTHRDLKPANILVTASGIKLLDFGLALLSRDGRQPAATDATATIGMTKAGTILGTAAYMSPEQAGAKPVDARSDIFSFGLVLYEMLSGRRAFTGDSTIAIMAAIVRDEPESLEATPALQSIVTRCLRKSPADRFQSMTQVKDALVAATSGVSSPGAAVSGALTALQTQSSSVERTPSIAVLPFANMSADKENEYFSDGLAEEILNALTRVPGLKVTARTSSFAFRGEKQDIRKIGEALDVRTVLEGSVRSAGNRIRVMAQLINVSDGYRLWSERYDREMTDVFAVQDEISQAIVETLKVQFTQGKPGGRPVAVGQQTNIEAYQAYLKGRYHALKLNPEDLVRAKTYIDEAIALDPSYAPAYVVLARCLVANVGLVLKPVQEVLPLAKAAALKAVELNEIDAGAHAVLASIATFDYDWKEALRQCQIALSCGPISAEDRAACALGILIPLRRFDEAIAVVQPAVASDPLSPLPRIALGVGLLSLGSHERAIQEFRRVLELQEDFWAPYAGLGTAYTIQGRTAEAIAALERGVQVAPWNPILIGMLAGNCARGGDRARAETVLAPVEASPQPLFRALGYAFYYILCSEFERAADDFEKAMEARHPATMTLGSNPFFERFRNTPRGRALLAKMNLADVAASGA